MTSRASVTYITINKINTKFNNPSTTLRQAQFDTSRFNGKRGLYFDKLSIRGAEARQAQHPWSRSPVTSRASVTYITINKINTKFNNPSRAFRQAQFDTQRSASGFNGKRGLRLSKPGRLSIRGVEVR